jgi:hypothetical protein
MVAWVGAYGEADFGAGIGAGDVVEGFVARVDQEGAHAGGVVVAVPLVLRQVVGALHLEVALRELHLDEPGGKVAAIDGRGRGRQGDDRGR